MGVAPSTFHLVYGYNFGIKNLLPFIPRFPSLTRDRTGGPRHHVFPSLEAEELLGRTFPVKVAGTTMGFCFFPLEFSLQFVWFSFLSCTMGLTQGFYPYEGLAYHCKTLSTCAAKNQFLSESFFWTNLTVPSPKFNSEQARPRKVPIQPNTEAKPDRIVTFQLPHHFFQGLSSRPRC